MFTRCTPNSWNILFGSSRWTFLSSSASHPLFFAIFAVSRGQLLGRESVAAGMFEDPGFEEHLDRLAFGQESSTRAICSGSSLNSARTSILPGDRRRLLPFGEDAFRLGGEHHFGVFSDDFLVFGFAGSRDDQESPAPCGHVILPPG